MVNGKAKQWTEEEILGLGYKANQDASIISPQEKEALSGYNQETITPNQKDVEDGGAHEQIDKLILNSTVQDIIGNLSKDEIKALSSLGKQKTWPGYKGAYEGSAIGRLGAGTRGIGATTGRLGAEAGELGATEGRIGTGAYGLGAEAGRIGAGVGRIGASDRQPESPGRFTKNTLAPHPITMDAGMITPQENKSLLEYNKQGGKKLPNLSFLNKLLNKKTKK
jgi:hypothetical protein